VKEEMRDVVQLEEKAKEMKKEKKKREEKNLY
jgi:hypothetical protein